MAAELPIVYTLGHSTRSIEDFLQLVTEHSLVVVADIRRFPYSRRHPQFGKEDLAKHLAAHAAGYVHLESLGGRRDTSPDSVNTGWKNDSFRGYADHMATPEFQAAVDSLVHLPGPSTILCAEAVPWRCHRNLVSDELVRRGHPVVHILAPRSTRSHVMNPMAVDVGTHLIYPGEQGRLGW